MMWMDFNSSFDDFCKRGKNDPGVLIEVLLNNKKKHILIGDVSPYGSVMNGDILLLKDTLILRYRRIWAR